MADPIFGVSGLKTLPKADPAATNVLDNTPDVNLPDVTEGVDLKTDALTTWFGKLLSELAPAVVSQEEQAELADIANGDGSSNEKEAAQAQLNASYAVNAFASPFIRLVILTYVVVIILKILKHIPGVSGVPSLSDIANKLFNGGSYDWSEELEVNGYLMLDDTIWTGYTQYKNDSEPRPVHPFKYTLSTEAKELNHGANYEPYPQTTKMITKNSDWAWSVEEHVPVFPETGITNYSVNAFRRYLFKAYGSAEYYFKFIKGFKSQLQYGDEVYHISDKSSVPDNKVHVLEITNYGVKDKATDRQLGLKVETEIKKGKSALYVSCEGFPNDVPDKYAIPYYTKANDKSLYFVKDSKYNAEDDRIELTEELQVTNLTFEKGEIFYGYEDEKLEQKEQWSALLLTSSPSGTYYLERGIIRRSGSSNPIGVDRFDERSSGDSGEVHYGPAYSRNKNNVMFYTYMGHGGDVVSPVSSSDDEENLNSDQYIYVAKIMYKGIHRLNKKFPPMIYEDEYESFYADGIEIWGYQYYPRNGEYDIDRVIVHGISINDENHQANGEFCLKTNSDPFITENAEPASTDFRNSLNHFTSAKNALSSSSTPSQAEYESIRVNELSPAQGVVQKWTRLDKITQGYVSSAREIFLYSNGDAITEGNTRGWQYVYTKTATMINALLLDYPDIETYLKSRYAKASSLKTCLTTNGQYTASDEGAGNIKLFYINGMSFDTFRDRCINSEMTKTFEEVFYDQTYGTSTINDVVAKFDDDSDYPLNGEETSGSDKHKGFVGGYTIGSTGYSTLAYCSILKNSFIYFEDGKATVKNKVEMNKAVPDAQPHFFQDAPEMVFEAKDPCTIPQSAMDKKMAMLLENDADQFTVMAAFGCCYTDDLWDKFQELKKLRRHMVRN